MIDELRAVSRADYPDRFRYLAALWALAYSSGAELTQVERRDAVRAVYDTRPRGRGYRFAWAAHDPRWVR